MSRIAVFGGVYANPWALEAVIADARARGAERLVCLGDLGGFGARPAAIPALLVGAGVECIAGNYDISIAEDADDCGCGYADPRDEAWAQVMYDFTRRATPGDARAWMAALPREWREVVAGVDVHMVHGSPLAVNDFMWESLPDAELAARVRASGADVLVCTHTGIPWTRRVAGTLVVNVGTIGRSANDGRPVARYALLDLDDGAARASLVAVAYDHRAHAASIRAAGLPEAFAVTAETGWWTTCLQVVPPEERARGRYHVYRDPDPASPSDPLPAVPLFGSEWFPSRLWIYTNFHCNLACGYCAVASSPRARPRSLGAERVRALVDEAVAAGFTSVHITGGEPLLERDIVESAAHAAARLPTTLLTNAMLLASRPGLAERLAAVPGLVLQTSLDGADARTHDALRGSGTFTRTLEGIAAARAAGLRVLVSTTAAGDGGAPSMAGLLADLGVRPGDHAVRPLVARGGATDGLSVDVAGLVPEITVTADGVHWHPVGADRDTSPDLMVAEAPVALADAVRTVTRRWLELRTADGTLPSPYACALPAAA